MKRAVSYILTIIWLACSPVFAEPEPEFNINGIAPGMHIGKVFEESEVLKLGEDIVDAESILKPNSITEDGDFAYFRVGEKVIRLDLEMNKISWFSLWVEDQE